MNRFIALIICFLTGMPAMAAYNFVSIQDYELWTSTYGDERIRVLPVTVVNPENCLNPDSYMIDTTLSEQNKARIYSTLLAAVLSDRSIRVVLDGCQDARPKITAVLIK